MVVRARKWLLLRQRRKQGACPSSPPQQQRPPFPKVASFRRVRVSRLARKPWRPLVVQAQRHKLVSPPQRLPHAWPPCPPLVRHRPRRHRKLLPMHRPLVQLVAWPLFLPQLRRARRKLMPKRPPKLRPVRRLRARLQVRLCQKQLQKAPQVRP